MKIGKTMLFYDTREETPIIYGFNDQEPIYKGRHVLIDQDDSIKDDECEIVFIKNAVLEEGDYDGDNLRDDILEQIEEKHFILKYSDVTIYPETFSDSFADLDINEWCLGKIIISKTNYNRCYMQACYGVDLIGFIDKRGYDNFDLVLKPIMNPREVANDLA